MDNDEIVVVKKKRFNKSMIPAIAGSVIMVGIMAAMIVNGIMLNNRKNDPVPPVDTSSVSVTADTETDIDTSSASHENESKKENASSKTESKKDTSSKASSSKASSAKVASSKASSSKASSSAPAAHNGTAAAAPASNTAAPVSDPPASAPQPVQQEYVEPVPETVVVTEEFDDQGRLIIDTDMLDGKKAIAVTFDDGPSIYTQSLVEGLNARGAKATFFMVGSNADRYPELVRFIADSGHQIGNHTYNHINMTSYSEYTWSNEIAITDAAIERACGQTATAFRPPYGSYSKYMASVVDKTFTVWSVDTLDWKSRNTDSVRSNMLNYCKDGSIVLLHDLYKTSVEGALQAIDILQQQGYVFVTVDELLTRYGYPISNTPHFSQYPVSKTVQRIVEPEPIEEPETDTSTEITEPIEETDTDTETETETEIDTESDTAVSDETDTEFYE